MSQNYVTASYISGLCRIVCIDLEETCDIYILFAGREVRIEKNCARGLEYGPRPQAEGRAQDRGHSFSQYGPTKAGK